MERFRKGGSPKRGVLEAVSSTEALARSLREGDAVILVNMPGGGLARRIVKRVRGTAAAGASNLTVAERRFLKGSGFSLEEPPLDEDPVVWGEHEYGRLVGDSLTTSQLAAKMGVTEGRIRQRLLGEPRTLLGIRTARGWRVPLYQFRRRKPPMDLVPGLEKVIPRLDPEHHPVSIHRWLTGPDPDLEDEAGNALSPLSWLRAGRSPSVVAELAAEL